MSQEDRQKLPDGWKWVKLGNVCEQETGFYNPAKELSKLFQYIDISSVDNVSKQIIEAQTLLGKDAPSRARKIIHTKDVLVATTRPNLNAVAMIPPVLDKQICSTGFCVLRAKKCLEPIYLFKYVQSPNFVNNLSNLVKGAMYPAVTDSQVREQLIPLPPLSEQKRIAAILNEQLEAVEKARQATEAQLEAAKKLPATYLREVFESEEAKSWERKRLGDIAETCSGTTPSRDCPEYYMGIIPWVKTGELQDNIIRETEEYISEVALRETSLKLLPIDTLLIAMYGQGQTRGRTALLAESATTNQACFAILPNYEEFYPLYLQWWFRQNYTRLRQETERRGGNQPNLNGDVLRNQKIIFPKPERQKQIASTLTQKIQQVEHLKQTLQDQLDAIDKLPAVLLRRAFKGEL